MERSGTGQTVGLPPETTSFVGRRQELTEIRRLLSASRLLTLIGPGGVGKTRLAAQAARRLARAFPNGVWLVSLAGLSDDALVPNAVANALGIPDDASHPSTDLVVEHLCERRLLLVLDNCEHLSGACVRLVHRILSEAPGVRILATSRHRLGLAGEQLLDVPALRVPTLAELAGGPPATTFPALGLFADRAVAVVPDFRLTADNAGTVARLCRRLDGLPLAIELAAVQMQAHSTDQLVELLDNRFELLTGGSRATLPRHQTLRSTIDWSHELCTRQEQLVWELLSVFPGSFDVAAAEAVCAGNNVEPVDVLETIAQLVDKSILASECHDDVVRYRLLSTLREYGLEKLNELGEVQPACRRHRDHYLHLAEEYEEQWFGPRQPEILDGLKADLDNFRVALKFCISVPGEVQYGLRLAGALWCYWVPGRAWNEVRYWFDRAIHRGGSPKGWEARALWVAASMMMVHMRSAAMLHTGDQIGQSAPTSEAASSPTPLADLVLASQHPNERLMSFVVVSRIELACSLIFQARSAEAVPPCVEVLAVCEAYNEQWARSHTLRTLTLARWMAGEYDAASAHARECLQLRYVVHDGLSLHATLDLLAAIAAGEGDAERAAALQGAAERIWHDIGHDTVPRSRAGRAKWSERQARGDLGDDAFERARRRGGALSREEVISYALQDRSAASRPAKSARTAATARGSFGVELTPRETQVLELLAQGLTNKQIAAALVVAQRTAEGYVERILAKLGLTNRTQAIAWVESQQARGDQPRSP